MKTKIIIIVIFLNVFLICSAYSQTAKVTIKVLDEAGNPIENAKVGIGFSMPKKPGKGWGYDVEYKEVFTDPNGLASSIGECCGFLNFGVEKEGFYDTSGPKIIFEKSELNKWQPWNPTYEVTLKKIENPVPMYAKKEGYADPLEIPQNNKPIGYDLMIGDWVSPYGKGKVADFIFELERRYESVYDYECNLTLKFSNKGDGIQSVLANPSEGSMLRLPRFAPEEGYEPELILTEYQKPGRGFKDIFKNKDNNENQNYFFRVRTEKKDEQIISALYGKIHGKIRFDCINSKKSAYILFHYYLNPDGTCNMEFDPQKNLFEGLSTSEEVRDP